MSQAKEACAHYARRRECLICCPNPKSCDFEGCGSIFRNWSTLEAHQRKHTGDLPFGCDHEGCGKRFTQAGHLEAHQRTHTGDQPFACDHEGCGMPASRCRCARREMRWRAWRSST